MRGRIAIYISGSIRSTEAFLSLYPLWRASASSRMNRSLEKLLQTYAISSDKSHKWSSIQCWRLSLVGRRTSPTWSLLLRSILDFLAIWKSRSCWTRLNLWLLLRAFTRLNQTSHLLIKTGLFLRRFTWTQIRSIFRIIKSCRWQGPTRSNSTRIIPSHRRKLAKSQTNSSKTTLN